MNKFDYLFEAINNRAYNRKSFLLSVFSIVTPSVANNNKLKTVPYALLRDPDTKEVYFLKEGKKVVIEHAEYDKALFNKNDKITVDISVHEFIKEKIETTVGLLLVNLVVFFESVGHAASYINGPITPGTVRGLIDSIMVDDPKEGETIPSDKASVTQCLNITKNLDYLEGLNDVFVKASSLDVLTVHPDVIKLRDKLLNELEKENKLNDAAAVAKVIDEVVALDASIQYNGTSKDFFIDKKFIDNARKKMFVVFDMVPDFNTGKYQLLRNSLNEGWDKDNYPAYINTAISGSYDRGNATGEGGAEVKVMILLTDRIEAIDTDCQTPRTETVTLNDFSFGSWVGGYYKTADGLKVLTKADKALLGKPLEFRVPQFCEQGDFNLCKVCCGEKLGAIQNRVSAETVLIFTHIMLGRMKSIHMSQLKMVKIDVTKIVK